MERGSSIKAENDEMAAAAAVAILAIDFAIAAVLVLVLDFHFRLTEWFCFDLHFPSTTTTTTKRRSLVWERRRGEKWEHAKDSFAEKKRKK